jgi:hypothetical protein
MRRLYRIEQCLYAAICLKAITDHRLYLEGQTVHAYFTNARITLSFVFSWYIRGRFSQHIINTTCDGRLLLQGNNVVFYGRVS